VLPEIQPYYVTRAMLGTTIMIGAYIGVYNIFRSLFYNPAVSPVAEEAGLDLITDSSKPGQIRGATTT
jgi:hypothetical protein